MAIAFDATASSSTGGVDNTSLTYAHTVTGSNPVLLVGVTCIRGGGLGDSVTGVTYNGVSMTQLGKTNDTNANTFIYIYGLVGPATGAHNVVISTSGNTDINSASGSYTDVKQTGLPDAVTTNTTASATSLITSLSSVADNCWHVEYAGAQAAISASTNFTGRSTTPNGQSIFGDSNSAKTPAGSVSLTVATSSSTRYGAVMVSIAPFVSSTANSNFFLLL